MNEGVAKWLPWAIAGVLAVIVAVLVIANLGDDDPEAIATTTTSISTTTSAPASTTTMTETTTSTVAETTTSTPAETTTTAPEETSTTTSAVPGVLELSVHGVQAGEVWVHFGFDDEEAIAAVSAVLGAPDRDSGWVDSFSEYGTCPGPDVRGIHWGDFVMLMTHADDDFWTGGVPHFFAYNYTAMPPELATTEGIELGSTVADLKATYGGPDFVLDEAWFDPVLGFWSYKLTRVGGLSGYSTGQSDTDTVTSILGGQGCGE